MAESLREEFGVSVLHEYVKIITDLAHTLVELTFTGVVDVLILGLLWPLVKRKIRQEHKAIDTEHGYQHHSKQETWEERVARLKSRREGAAPPLSETHWL